MPVSCSPSTARSTASSSLGWSVNSAFHRQLSVFGSDSFAAWLCRLLSSPRACHTSHRCPIFFSLASPAPLCLWWAPVPLPLLLPLYKNPIVCDVCVFPIACCSVQHPSTDLHIFPCCHSAPSSQSLSGSHPLELHPAASAPCRTGDTSRVISLNSIPGKRQRYPTLDSLGTYLGHGAFLFFFFNN